MTSHTAAFLIIGNEILSGRTTEKNLPVLAALLATRGVPLVESRIVPDIATEIGTALNALRARADFVFTSGGIGPTHDDITNDSIAQALALPTEENPAALQKLQSFYDTLQQPLTPVRRRMARLPQNATIINGDYPGAPAYQVENVFVCAGVPKIFQQMATAAVALLPQGTVRQTASLHIQCGESRYAETLTKLAEEFPSVEMGSYPREKDGQFFCEVVFSGEVGAEVQQAQVAFSTALTAAGIPHQPPA